VVQIELKCAIAVAVGPVETTGNRDAGGGINNSCFGWLRESKQPGKCRTYREYIFGCRCPPVASPETSNTPAEGNKDQKDAWCLVHLPNLWPLADLSVKDYKQYGGVSTPIALRFGERLKDLRKRRGWTQVRTADQLGIDRSYVSDMERGKKNVCLPTMEILAQGFGITLARNENLFGRRGKGDPLYLGSEGYGYQMSISEEGRETMQSKRPAYKRSLRLPRSSQSS